MKEWTLSKVKLQSRLILSVSLTAKLYIVHDLIHSWSACRGCNFTESCCGGLWGLSIHCEETWYFRKHLFTLPIRTPQYPNRHNSNMRQLCRIHTLPRWTWKQKMRVWSFLNIDSFCTKKGQQKEDAREDHFWQWTKTNWLQRKSLSQNVIWNIQAKMPKGINSWTQWLSGAQLVILCCPKSCRWTIELVKKWKCVAFFLQNNQVLEIMNPQRFSSNQSHPQIRPPLAQKLDLAQVGPRVSAREWGCKVKGDGEIYYRNKKRAWIESILSNMKVEKWIQRKDIPVYPFLL